MNIEVLENTDQQVRFVLDGAGHTFCNHLKHELYNDESIDVAAYKVDHPLTGIPSFILHTKKKAKLKNILADATKRIKKQNKDFESAMSKL